MNGTLCITGDPNIDDIVNTNAVALMIAMLLDQQMSIELAFAGPSRLADRIGGTLTAGAVGDMAVDDLVAIFAVKPALHRFPAAMAQRTHALCTHLVEHYAGDPCAIWTNEPDARVVAKRLRALPGFGPEKTKIFVAVLAKRFGITPEGWQAAAGAFSDSTPRSVADVSDPTVLVEIRAYRSGLKAQMATLDKEA